MSILGRHRSIMEKDSFREDVVCWLCDHGIVLLVVFAVVILLLIFNRTSLGTLDLPPLGFALSPTPTTTSSPFPTLTATSLPSVIPTAVITPPATSIVQEPEIILAFVPLNWGAGDLEFNKATQQQADVFVTESGIDDYFSVDVVILGVGLDDADLTDPDLLVDVIRFGLEQVAADRYIGLTDGDLSPGGDDSVVGWTNPQYAGLVGESANIYVTAHELAHTFGLCDEYSYKEWSRQDDDALGGCPNPFPILCEKSQSYDVVCEGQPTADGQNSIMGPSGLSGEYGFNEASLLHLHQEFQRLVEESYP
jgi:hypothetical protein